MECQCGKVLEEAVMVRVWFPGQDDAVDELVCPECAAEYAYRTVSANPFDEEEVENG